jgi:NAD(P)-dependent dehydrogenase (short-subunit alcohol dehydrogenase family)
MLMSTLDGVETYPAYPELAGKRVLITGLNHAHGVDLARAFAEHRTRLVLQAVDDGEEMHAIAEIAARTALDIRFFNGPLSSAEAALRFARNAVKSYSGLDIVINITTLIEPSPRGNATQSEVERAVSRALTPAYVISRIAANRMRTTWTEGLILNVVPEIKPTTTSARALTAVARATLAAMTRTEAEKWAGDRIRINGVAPPTLSHGLGADLNSEPGIAELALKLASRRGRDVSGMVFESRNTA